MTAQSYPPVSRLNSQAGLASFVGGSTRPHIGDQCIQDRIEYGVKWSDGSITQCPDGPVESSRSRALDALSIDPSATLVSRLVEVHPWRAHR